MREIWEQTDAVYNRYMIDEFTSGRTEDIYLTDGEHTIMLEDCLIWEDTEFTDEDADDILDHLLHTTDGVGIGEYEGWYLIKEEQATEDVNSKTEIDTLIARLQRRSKEQSNW
jgi:hypothetical protein